MVHPKYNKIENLDKGIRELERQLQTTSTDGKKEREIIKEMSFIKESRPYIQELQTLKD